MCLVGVQSNLTASPLGVATPYMFVCMTFITSQEYWLTDSENNRRVSLLAPQHAEK